MRSSIKTTAKSTVKKIEPKPEPKKKVYDEEYLTNPLLNVLHLARDVLFKQKSPFKQKLAFKTGDIVLNERDGEYGVVLGERPAPLFKNIDDLVDQSQAIYREKAQDKTIMILLTLYKDSEVGEKNIYDWRVRYVNTTRLKKVEDIGDFKLQEINKDLKQYCENQCIFDCHQDCLLYKYKS